MDLESVGPLGDRLDSGAGGRRVVRSSDAAAGGSVFANDARQFAGSSGSGRRPGSDGRRRRIGGGAVGPQPTALPLPRRPDQGTVRETAALRAVRNGRAAVAALGLPARRRVDVREYQQLCPLLRRLGGDGADSGAGGRLPACAGTSFPGGLCRLCGGGALCGRTREGTGTALGGECAGAIESLILFYPVTKAFADGSASWERFGRGYGLDTVLMDQFNRAYAPAVPSGVSLIDVGLAPAEAVADLPRTLLVAAGRDILRDQGAEFAGRLPAGKIRRVEFPEAVHLFITVPGQEEAFRAAVTLASEFLELIASPKER